MAVFAGNLFWKLLKSHLSPKLLQYNKSITVRVSYCPLRLLLVCYLLFVVKSVASVSMPSMLQVSFVMLVFGLVTESFLRCILLMTGGPNACDRAFPRMTQFACFRVFASHSCKCYE